MWQRLGEPMLRGIVAAVEAHLSHICTQNSLSQLKSNNDTQFYHIYTTRVGCWAAQPRSRAPTVQALPSFLSNSLLSLTWHPKAPFFTDIQVTSASINTLWATVLFNFGYLATQTNCAPDRLCFTSAACQLHLLSEAQTALQNRGPVSLHPTVPRTHRAAASALTVSCLATCPILGAQVTMTPWCPSSKCVYPRLVQASFIVPFNICSRSVSSE